MPAATLTRLLLFALLQSGEDLAPRMADGYRGIWYSNEPSGDQYQYKYSGGFATYPQQHAPIAIYSRQAQKTFFVYGGTAEGKRELEHMVAYFDHRTGMVPRPVRLLNKKTGDAHDNPTLSIDNSGYLYVFSNSHGGARPSFIHRSRKPYSIDDFELVSKIAFSYSQPWYLSGRGFLFLHTKYEDGGRSLFVSTSPDARAWTTPERLVRIEQGDYQISRAQGSRAGTAFDLHPAGKGLNFRTNLHYLQTLDFGKEWRTAEGLPIVPPVSEPRNAALVRDYRAEGLLVYLKDLALDSSGHPVILYLTSRGYRSGPAAGPRQWWTAHWQGSRWDIRPLTTSDHNYDHGALYVESDGTWRVIAPTDPGPQAWGTGGEVVLWLTRNRGQSWSKVRQLTTGSRYNHTYVRAPLDAHPDFYALWADGDPFAPSESAIYFTNRDGTRVRRLPRKMEAAFARPELVPARSSAAGR